MRKQFQSLVACGMMLLLLGSSVRAASKDLGNGFRDHGVTVPISNHRGLVATVDGAGRNVVLLWLMDHRGGYSLLLIDAQTGKAEQFPVPFTPAGESFDSPYSSLLSSGNKFYTHFHRHFLEFDPAKPAFTFCSEETTPLFAMGMTEDDQGVIWSVTYPQSGVVSFDPKSRAFHDYGEAYKQNWPEYPSFVSADDAGWVYFGVGFAASQIIAFDPKSGKATPLLSEEEREKGMAFVYRDKDGKVYGQPLRDKGDNWLSLYKGTLSKIGKHDASGAKPIVTGNQAMFRGVFPDGTKVKDCNLADRKLVIQTAQGEKEFSFDYESDGAVIETAQVAPDGTICGGTSFPMRFYSYNPKTDSMLNRPAYGQWNTVVRQGDHFFAGGYPGGFLLDWDPSKPWVNTDQKKANSNPLYLTQVSPTIHRPHRLLAYTDGKTIVMGGTPEYGSTGGGLLFWDREKRASQVLTDAQVIPDQSTIGLIVSPDGKLIGGTTTSAGTGGEKKAAQAEIYIMDFASKKVEWHEPLISGVQEYADLCAGPNGLAYGIADRKTFFVFDPAKRKVIHQEQAGSDLGEAHYYQGPRNLISAPDGATYALFQKGVARIEPESYKLTLLASSPLPIEQGGDYLDGRIYFISGSHLCSYQVK